MVTIFYICGWIVALAFVGVIFHYVETYRKEREADENNEA